MARFHGEIGFGESVETKPGVWENIITERNYYGDVLQNTRKLEQSELLNNDLTVSNSISIMSDVYANEHISAIQYVKWAGTRWTVVNVEIQSPRLILRMGGVFNG